MLVHDSRVAKASVGKLAKQQYRVTPEVSLKHIVSWVRTVAKGHGGISKLYILAHGVPCANNICDGGIQLGRDGINYWNVEEFSALKELVQTIVVIACGVAS